MLSSMTIPDPEHMWIFQIWEREGANEYQYIKNNLIHLLTIEYIKNNKY